MTDPTPGTTDGAPHGMSETGQPSAAQDDVARPPVAWWKQALPWLITLACFAYLYTKLQGAAAREGVDLVGYLGGVFGRVDWTQWLGLMIPYSFLFFLIDSLVVWRVISWFNTPIRYVDILPVRGSSYILSIINEQVGKGGHGRCTCTVGTRRTGLGSWLEHALHHVLRVLLPPHLGDPRLLSLQAGQLLPSSSSRLIP